MGNRLKRSSFSFCAFSFSLFAFSFFALFAFLLHSFPYSFLLDGLGFRLVLRFLFFDFYLLFFFQ